MPKRWQCSVCGYVHVGEHPPVSCPVCGADRAKFVLLEELTTASEAKTGVSLNATYTTPKTAATRITEWPSC